MKKIFILLIVFITIQNLFASESVKIASVQYPIQGNQSLESFFKKVEKYVAEAANKKADLILFPEWVTLDTWPLKKKMSDHEVILSIAKNISEKYWEHLKNLSKKYKIVIAGGSTAVQSENKIYNSAVVSFPDGRLIEHKKVYLTKWEIENGISSGKAITVFDTQWGRVALFICYDIEFPDLSVDLAKNEIDLILVPSMTESASGVQRVRWSAQARAVEHTSYVVISPTIGKTSDSWSHYGRAVFLSPQLPGMDGVLREGSINVAGVWSQTLNLKLLRNLKKTTAWRPSKQIRDRN